MGQRLFGTDGVRGLANGELTAELALDLSVAAAHVLGEAGVFEGHRPRAVVGRDPRASGEFLEAAVVAGLASAGVDVVRLGVLPTPAVAYLTGSTGADLGVMLSASHNPMPDNGIKFLAPGGLNINLNCGSTHMEGLQREVVGHRADVGIALDGDADRCLAVDANGDLVDGDQILAILALAMRDSGRLSNDTVVATVVSNLGFVQAMVRERIAVEQTKVGDRYVLEAMKAGGYTLGGEQSGHVVLSEFSTTGDRKSTRL